MPNRLQHESSLYLRQHADNPVDWHPWGDEAIAQAKAEDRPIFLSIGYSACHWCHVMEHESFEDATTAEVMNANFINIKVDREERPDLDQIYMTSLQLLTREGGGWPLSVFLTPDLTPFYAGTYFPPREAYGRPSFRRVLLAIAESWKSKREQLVNVGRQVTEALQESLTVSKSEGELNEATLRKALAALKRNYDAKYGGFGHAPKFPHPVDLRLLLKLGKRFDDAEAINMVMHTLTMMARGGIYDQISGGFHRYSVDEKWLVPHFEKMLYDNALLVPVYLEAFQITQDRFFEQIACETLDYVLREMTSPGGGFYSTQDADSEGEEGKFYVWSDAEIGSILGEDAEIARREWGITPSGNFEGHNILIRNHHTRADDQILAMKRSLYAVRAKRVWPGRDEKMLTAWNGLMIATLSQAYRTTFERKYLEAAQSATRFLLDQLRTPEGRLLRTCGDHHPAKLAGYLEDYAYVIEALTALYEADFDPQWITTACELADKMIALFFDNENGGFFFAEACQNDLISRTKDWHDGSTPSGNAVAATALLKLAILCDRPDYRAAAEKTLQAFSGMVSDNPAAAAQMLIALDFQLGPVREIAIVGPDDISDTNHVIGSLGVTSHPRQVVAYYNTLFSKPPACIALLRDKTGTPNEVTTYICQNSVCAAPIIGAAAAMAALT